MARFDAPTPRVAIATAGTPVSLASASAGRDERQFRMALHGVYDLQEALAGDGVEAPHPGPRQHLDRGVAGFDPGASGHRILLLIANLAVELRVSAYTATGTSLPPRDVPF
jgi:hypothetical protein